MDKTPNYTLVSCCSGLSPQGGWTRSLDNLLHLKVSQWGQFIGRFLQFSALFYKCRGIFRPPNSCFVPCKNVVCSCVWLQIEEWIETKEKRKDRRVRLLKNWHRGELLQFSLTQLATSQSHPSRAHCSLSGGEIICQLFLTNCNELISMTTRS